jgi:hypothetical protein
MNVPNVSAVLKAIYTDLRVTVGAALRESASLFFHVLVRA